MQMNKMMVSNQPLYSQEWENIPMKQLYKWMQKIYIMISICG